MDEDRFDKVVKYFMRHRAHIGGIFASGFATWYVVDKFTHNLHGELILALTGLSTTIFGSGAFKSDEFHKAND